MPAPMARKGDNTHLLFGDVAHDPTALSERFDEYTKALDAAPWGQVDNTMKTVAGNLRVTGNQRTDSGTMLTVEKSADPLDQMQALLKQDTIDKAIGDDIRGSLQQALTARQDITKDLTLSNPVNTGLVLYDLKHPAEFLVPVETPLRNTFHRTQGVGTSFQYKQITGITNAQTTAGLPQLHPGISDSTQTNFAAPGSANGLYYNRGPKIEYAGQDVSASYFQFGLSDEVTWSAQFAGAGFQDIRQLSQTSVLYASMLAEERMTIYGRGTSANGYAGALTTPTVTAADGTGAGSLTAATAYDVAVAASSGFGTTAAGTASHTLGSSATSLAISWGAVPGAVGYDVYVGASGGTKYFVGHYGSGTLSVEFDGPVPTSGVAAPTTDTSAQAVGYDGIIPIVTGPNSGYVGNVGAKLSTTNPGTEFQTAFMAMYNQNLANPDWVLLNGADRVQLSDTIKGSGSVNSFRLNIQADGSAGHQVGNIVATLQNEVTGKMVNLMVHPYMPQGIAPIITDALPFPNSNVSSCFEYRNVQDYMGINWPVQQFTYDVSSYWYGTFFCHAPAWQGCLTGIAAQ